MTRSERQELCIQKWIAAKCRGTLELATGFGSIYLLLKKVKHFITFLKIRAVLYRNIKNYYWVISVKTVKLIPR